jgi:hypothetical protein
MNKDGTSVHFENIKQTVLNLNRNHSQNGALEETRNSKESESAFQVYGLKSTKSQRFVPMCNGKIIVGGKALSVNEFLTTRNNRGLKTEGTGEEPDFRKSIEATLKAFTPQLFE